MKDIIIVGVSKAGNLHLQSYNKLENKGKIFLVDNQKEKKGTTKKIYKTVEEAIRENNLDVQNLIVDICTPKGAFNKIINECMVLNIKTILIEKPFIVDKKFLEQNKDLRIIMIQNYLYSKITKDIKKYIEEKKLKIQFIYTNFSKNRIKESIKGRGMIKGSVTRNIEIEMPHQIYVADYLIGEYKKEIILFLEEKDMQDKEIVLKKHGYGKIICKKDDALVIHESDLTTSTITREVIIACDDDIIIKGEYLVYDKKFNVISPGYMQVLKNGAEVFRKKYEEDDNIFECIKDAYQYFNCENIDKKYEQRLIKFGTEFFKYMNM